LVPNLPGALTPEIQFYMGPIRFGQEDIYTKKIRKAQRELN
jgi:hypothetical protein